MVANVTSRVRIILALSIFLMLQFMNSANADDKYFDQSKYKLIASKALNSARAIIASSHPGYIDLQNHGFIAVENESYNTALDLIQNVDSRSDAFAVLKVYVNSFQDGHLQAFDPSAASDLKWAGWLVEKKGQSYVIKHAAKSLDLQIGSVIQSCNGKSIENYLTENLSRYIDQRLTLGSARSDLVKSLTITSPSVPIIGEFERVCEIISPQGRREVVKIEWRAATDELYSLLTQPSRSFGFEMKEKGLLWIRASDFSISNASSQKMEKVLNDLVLIDQAKAIVFDTRGNQGGDSAIGDRILRAIFGSKYVDDLRRSNQQEYAEWRVSDFAIQALKERDVWFASSLGQESQEFRMNTRLLGLMRDAKKKKIKWVRQPDDIKETFYVKKAPLQSKVFLITDERCTSACLDFVDVIKKIPDVQHIGQPTSGDTNYIDVGTADVDGGFKIWVPLKVWRNRVRGSNMFYVPNVEVEDIWNDDALTELVYAKLGISHGKIGP